MTKLDKMETMDGNVTFYYDINDRYYAQDIDVKPGAETVEVCLNLEMGDTTKSFPDVKELVIQKDVREIIIPNTLFPNVRKVKSHSFYFKTGRDILINTRYSYTLINTFCKNKDEVIDLNEVTSIGDFAFKDCECTNVRNTHRVNYCTASAFIGSAFLEQPFDEGVRMAGTILVDVDNKADIVDLHDNIRSITAIWADLSKAKNIVTHKFNTIYNYNVAHISKTVTLDMGYYISDTDLLDYATISKIGDGRNIEHIEILKLTPKTEKNCNVKEVDGVVYSGDFKRLIACSHGVRNLTIPDGVEEIGYCAFSKGNIESVCIPDSVQIIKTKAFTDCVKLKKVKFGTGLDEISTDVFYGCRRLESVDIPGNVMQIRSYAFAGSGIKSVTLHEGLTNINSYAFVDTPMEEIVIPKSVNVIGSFCFGKKLKRIVLKRYIPHITDRFTTTATRMHRKNQLSKAITVKCGNKEVIFPQVVSRYTNITHRVDSFFAPQGTEKYCSVFDCAHNAKNNTYFAFLEYEKYKNKEAKEYLKKHAKELAFDVMEMDEDIAIRFFRLGVVSKVTLKKIMDIADEKGMAVVKTYVMEQLGNNKNSASGKFKL